MAAHSTTDTWTLAGTTTAGTGATVNLGGTVQLDTGFALTTAAGTLNLTGTLDLAGGTVHTLTLDAASGSLNLRTGTILGGTVSGSDGARLVAAFGTSYLRQGVTLDADLDMTATQSIDVYVYDGLTLNGTIGLGSTDGVRSGALWFYGTQTLGGTGDVLFGGHALNLIQNRSNGGDAGALTIGPGITIHGENGTVGNSAYPVINQGTIDADVAGGTIVVYGGPLTNEGTLKADGGVLGVHFGTGGTSTGTLAAVNGGTLSTIDTWTLAGTTTAGTGATVNLGGTVQLDTGFALTTAAGTLNLTGTLDLAGGTVHTLTLDAASGSLNLRNSAILGGTVSGSGGAQLVAAFGNNYLRQGVTLDADLDMTATQSIDVYVYDGLTLNGTIGLGSADGAVASATCGSTAIRRSKAPATVVLGGNASNLLQNRPNGGDAGTLTIGSGITVHGKTGTIGSSLYPLINQGTITADVAGGTIDVLGGPLTNQGTIGASAGILRILASNWSNAGTIRATGGQIGLNNTWTTTGLIAADSGIINLNGNFTQGTGASFTAGAGTFRISGTFDNTGTTFALDAPAGTLELRTGGTIQGGTVALSGGVVLVAAESNANLNGVTLEGDLDLTTLNYTYLNVYGGLTLEGTIFLGAADGSTYGRLFTRGAVTLGGTGDVLFGGSTNNQIDNQYDSGSGTLTLGPDLTVHGQNGTVGSSSYPMINQGTIDADTSGDTITVQFAGGSNDGTLAAHNGGVLTTASTWTDTGADRGGGRFAGLSRRHRHPLGQRRASPALAPWTLAATWTSMG